MHKSERKIKQFLERNEKLINELGLTTEYTKNHWSSAFEILRWATCRWLLTIHAAANQEMKSESEIQQKLESFQVFLTQVAALEGQTHDTDLLEIHNQWPHSKVKMAGWGCV